MAISIGILLAALWLGALVLCLQLLMMGRKQPRSKFKRKSKPRRRPSRQSAQYSALENRLLNLLNGDQGAAQRLIGASRQVHPGRPEVWHWEKVIYDLERDRR